MWSLTESPWGYDRWWMRCRPLSCLGTRPRGEEICDGLTAARMTRPRARSLSSCLVMISGASSAELRLEERMNASGPL